MNEKLIVYIGDLKERIATLRSSTFEENADDHVACEAVADALELVVKELADLLEVR